MEESQDKFYLHGLLLPVLMRLHPVFAPESPQLAIYRLLPDTGLTRAATSSSQF